jgi:uncharacterized membrane protein
MPSPSRVGNSLFFIGLIVLVLAGIAWSSSDDIAIPFALTFTLVALLLMGVGGWLWNKPDPNAPVPLSHQSPKAKMLAAIPGLITLYISTRPGSEDKVGQSIGLALMAFALVGALETFIDRKFPNAKANWDAMATWKKISISFVVIVASIFLFLYAMMEVARLLSR